MADNSSVGLMFNLNPHSSLLVSGSDCYHWRELGESKRNTEAFRVEIPLGWGRRHVVRVKVNSFVVREFRYILSESVATIQDSPDELTLWKCYTMSCRGGSHLPRHLQLTIFGPRRCKDFVHTTETTEDIVSDIHQPRRRHSELLDIETPATFDTGFERLPETVFEYDPCHPYEQDEDPEPSPIHPVFM